MTSRKLSALIIALVLALSLSAVSFAGTVNTSNPIVPIVKKASIAVVNIDVEMTARRPSGMEIPFEDDPLFKRFFGDSFNDFRRSVPMKGRGSGFIVTKEGQILTNNHVVSGASKITVSVLLADGNKKTYTAKIVGSDPTYDLAIIKIEPDAPLPVLELGDSDAVEVGEYVIAIGNPYGFEQSVTAGVISAKNRSVRAQDVNFDDFLQTDAAINPGNSGGPLLNMDGKVIGINTAIVPNAHGLGFAIPINKAKEIMGDLVAHGHVRRGWLGVSVRDITEQMARAYGVKDKQGAMINDVFRGDPAAKAGIKRGDVVVEINGEKIKNSSAFVQKIRTIAPGTTVKLVIIRKGKRMNFSVKLAERPDSADGRSDRRRGGDDEEDEYGEGKGGSRERGSSRRDSEALRDFGITRVAKLTDSMRNEYGIDSGSEGLVVLEVDRETSAYDDAGIREGDLIIEINGYEVKDTRDISRAVGSEDSIVLMIEREGSTYFVQLDKRR